MRVLRVIDSLDPRVGGPPHRAQQRHLCGKGRCPLRCGGRGKARRHAGNWWDAIVERCSSEGIGLSAYPVSAPWLSPHHYDPSASLVRRLLRRRRSHYDIVHAESPWTGACVTASAIAAVGGSRLVITPHEVFTPFDLLRGGSAIRTAKRVGTWGYGRVVDKIVCSSPLEMRDSQSAGLSPRKLTWMYHPVVDDRALTARQSSLTGDRMG